MEDIDTKREGKARGASEVLEAANIDSEIGSKRKFRDAAHKLKRLKFSRGGVVPTSKLKDKKLRGQISYNERLVADATDAAARADEWLLPEVAGELEAEGMERTWRFAQEDIVREVESGAAAKAFDLQLPDLGPYCLSFTRNGRHMLFGGRKGQIAIVDWQQGKAVTEIQVRETTRDVTFLHNETFFAAAQKKYVYIYDKRGVEIHCLKEHLQPKRLEFLPYHFLLASIGQSGILRYQDTSTGELVAQISTKMAACHVMRQNPWNACMALGHANGVVSLWSPNVTVPLVKMLCHKGPVRSIAIDPMGQYMVTAGVDSEVKVWDVRNFKPLHTYFSFAPAANLDISQRGLLAVGFNRKIQVWKDALSQKQRSPYMTHSAPGVISRFRFCPYEDVLGIGHADGISTMLVPGAGEPNLDSRVADPFQARRARREQEVHSLLEKLQPEMIVLDPTSIGQILKEPQAVREESAALAKEANQARRKAQAEKNDQKTRMKGKNKPSRKFKKKQNNIIEEKKVGLRERIREEIGASEEKRKPAIPEGAPRALHRLYSKRAFT